MVHDAKLLIPTLKDFFTKHPLINPKTFLGDAAFDSALLYRQLLTGDASIEYSFVNPYFSPNRALYCEIKGYTLIPTNSDLLN